MRKIIISILLLSSLATLLYSCAGDSNEAEQKKIEKEIGEDLDVQIEDSVMILDPDENISRELNDEINDEMDKVFDDDEIDAELNEIDNELDKSNRKNNNVDDSGLDEDIEEDEDMK